MKVISQTNVDINTPVSGYATGTSESYNQNLINGWIGNIASSDHYGETLGTSDLFVTPSNVIMGSKLEPVYANGGIGVRGYFIGTSALSAAGYGDTHFYASAWIYRLVHGSFDLNPGSFYFLTWDMMKTVEWSSDAAVGAPSFVAPPFADGYTILGIGGLPGDTDSPVTVGAGEWHSSVTPGEYLDYFAGFLDTDRDGVLTAYGEQIAATTSNVGGSSTPMVFVDQRAAGDQYSEEPTVTDGDTFVKNIKIWEIQTGEDDNGGGGEDPDPDPGDGGGEESGGGIPPVVIRNPDGTKGPVAGLSWWDGSAKQPVELKGWWDGLAIQPLAGGTVGGGAGSDGTELRTVNILSSIEAIPSDFYVPTPDGGLPSDSGDYFVVLLSGMNSDLRYEYESNDFGPGIGHFYTITESEEPDFPPGAIYGPLDGWEASGTETGLFYWEGYDPAYQNGIDLLTGAGLTVEYLGFGLLARSSLTIQLTSEPRA